MAAGLYDPPGIELVLERTGPVTRKKAAPLKGLPDRCMVLQKLFNNNNNNSNVLYDKYILVENVSRQQ